MSGWPAQAGPGQFRHYDTGDGLPQAQVMALHQDPAGFLWVGTFGGLGRFDGRSFVRYSTSDGLVSNTVRSVTSAPDGAVWVGLSRGLCTLRPRQRRFECLTLPGIDDHNVQTLLWTADALWVGTGEALLVVRRGPGGAWAAKRVAAGGVLSLAADDSGGIWAGGPRGLLRVAPDGAVSAMSLPLQAEVRALLVDGPRLWIGTAAGLLLRQDGRVAQPPGLAADMAGVEVRGLAAGDGGDLWVATRLGLLRRAAGVFSRLGNAQGLVDENLHAVLHDREGVVWLASDAGLSSQLSGTFASYGTAQGLAHPFVRALKEDAAGQLWLGTRRGVQVMTVEADGQLRESLRIGTADGLLDDRIYDIVFPRPGEALLATGHGLAHWHAGGRVRLYTEADGLPANAVRALHVRDDGSVLVATMGGVAVLAGARIVPVAPATLAAIPVISMSRGSAGRIWIGSLQHGLLWLDPDGTLGRLDGDRGLTDETVWHTAPDAAGGLWIATNGDGLFHLDRAGALRRYTTREGLVDNFVWQVLADRQGQVWAYTNRGLARFDGQDFSSFSVEDGLPDQEGAATAALQTRDGQRWFGTNSGLARFVGDEAIVSRPAPPVVIHQALAGGQPMAERAALAPGTRGYEFQFSAPLFRRTSDLLYRYRLRGAGDDWDELHGDRPVAYANLGPGRYVFEVQARTSGRDWAGEPSRFAFEVEPPLWQTPWFQALVTAATALLLWLLIRLRMRRVSAAREALEQLVRERTLALEHANRQLEQASFTDPLTELRNRRYLASRVDSDVAQVHRAYAARADGSSRQAHPNRDMVMVMIDVDHFKQVNDSHGHDAGDRVLRQFAQLLRSVIRETDYAVRWGGEEFLLVLRQTEAGECALFAQRLVECVRGHAFAIDDIGGTLRTTCSVGMSRVPFVPGTPGALNWSQLIAVCDAALYLAKRAGRDRWVALHGVAGRDIGDAAAFVQRLKDDPLALIAEGQVTASGDIATATA